MGALTTMQESAFADVDALNEANAAIGWQAEYRQLQPGALEGRFASWEARGTVVTREMIGLAADLHAEAPAGTVQVIAAPGSTINGRRLTESQLFVGGPRAELEASNPVFTHAVSVHMPCAVYRTALSRLAPDAEAIAAGRSVVVDVRPELVRSIEDASRSLDADLETSWLDAMIERFIAASAGVPSEAARVRDAETFARARDFIEANLGESIRSAALCAHAGTGERTLERVFRREAGVSPMGYVLARRLHAARERLLRANGDERVVDVATACGFAHMGRFAGAYFSYFRESPSQTLKCCGGFVGKRISGPGATP